MYWPNRFYIVAFVDPPGSIANNLRSTVRSVAWTVRRCLDGGLLGTDRFRVSVCRLEALYGLWQTAQRGCASCLTHAARALPVRQSMAALPRRARGYGDSALNLASNPH